MFATPALSDRLLPALAHQRVTEVGANATHLLAWDSASTGVTPPKPPWGPDDYRQQGYIRGYNQDGIHTAYHVGANVLSLFDELTQTGIFWTPDEKGLPPYQDGSPFLIVLQWWARTQGLTLIHAAAVGTDEGGFLLVGAGGSGKSTAALACIGSSLRYVGDDYCLLESGETHSAHSLFSSGKLDDNSLVLLPHLRPAVSNPTRHPDEKALLYLDRAYPNDLLPSTVIKGILLPRVTGSRSNALRPASPGDALRALAPSTLFQLTGAGSESFERMVELVRSLPCYYLDLGPDVLNVPARISSLLTELTE